MNGHTANDLCPACEKPAGLCVCEAIAPVDNRIEVLILRHPQEQDRKLGTARIAALQLQRAQLKTGLSWPNLAKAVGRPVDPRRWGVLYLGTAVASGVATQTAGYEPIESNGRLLMAVNPKGEPAPDQDEQLSRLNGIILLDGNWQQAKALWWRNAWMLKCRRLVLNPAAPSLYGKLRREPRRESVSTIEAAALALAELQGDPALPEQILTPFRLLLEKARQTPDASPGPAPVTRWTS